MLKFLAFEQTFKNASPPCPLGGGRGQRFPIPRAERGEVMRFCQALMLGSIATSGPAPALPAGDIGVGGREVSYMAHDEEAHQ